MLGRLVFSVQDFKLRGPCIKLRGPCIKFRGPCIKALSGQNFFCDLCSFCPFPASNSTIYNEYTFILVVHCRWLEHDASIVVNPGGRRSSWNITASYDVHCTGIWEENTIKNGEFSEIGRFLYIKLKFQGWYPQSSAMCLYLLNF